MKNFKFIFFVICLIFCESFFIVLSQGAAPSSPRNPFEPQLPKRERVEPLPPIKTPKKGPDDAYSEDLLKKREEENKQITQPKPPMPALTITGIVWNSKKPQAIINGQVVGVGDSVSDVKIVSISKSGVEFDYYGEKIILRP